MADRTETPEHPLQRAWDAKRALQICKRGHPLPEYAGFGSVRRCAVCDRVRQLITDAKNKIGPVEFRLPSPRGPKTHCPKGHPYVGENVRLTRRGKVCRTCAKEFLADWKARKIAAGANPNRWKPTKRTVDRVLQAAKSGLSINEMKGRVRGIKAVVSSNTLINIRLWYPEQWAQASRFISNAKQVHFVERQTTSVAHVPVPLVLDDKTAAEFMKLAYRLMPRFVTGNDREEAVQKLVTAIIFGELNIADLNATTAKRFASAESDYRHRGYVSLDADLTGNGFTLMDTIQEEDAWNVPVNIGRRIGARRY